MPRDDSYWDFIAKYLPDYTSNEDVAESDLLWRYIDNEEMYQHDIERLEKSYPTKKTMLNEIAKIETKLFKEAMEEYIKTYAQTNRIR